MSGPDVEVVDRHIEPTLRARIAEEPVVVVHGARTVGKSTLVTRLARELGTEVLDLDDPATRSAVAADPAQQEPGPWAVRAHRLHPLRVLPLGRAVPCRSRPCALALAAVAG